MIVHDTIIFGALYSTNGRFGSDSESAFFVGVCVEGGALQCLCGTLAGRSGEEHVKSHHE